MVVMGIPTVPIIENTSPIAVKHPAQLSVRPVTKEKKKINMSYTYTKKYIKFNGKIGGSFIG